MLSNREIIQSAFVAIGSADTLADKIAAVAAAVEQLGEFDSRMRGAADRITTRQILRQLRMAGHA